MSSIPVVLRVKKRKLPSGAFKGAPPTAAGNNAASEAAAVRLLLAPAPAEKRPRLGASEGALTSGLFVFAGRVTSAEAALAEAAVRRAISKRKLDSESERLRRRLGERPSEGEGRLVYKRRRRVDPTPLRPLLATPAAGSDSTVASASESTASFRCFRIVDFETAGAGPPGRVSGDQIACNGVAMAKSASPQVAESAYKDESDGDGVYYDVYYGYCDGSNDGIFADAAGREERQQLQYLLQTYEEAYRYGDDDEDESGGLAFDVEEGGGDGDSDSNSESNWRNDYPDTPDGSSESDGKYDDDDDDDVDPYDDADGEIGGLARRLGSACVVAFDQDEADDADSSDDCEATDTAAAAELQDWRDFKRQLLQQRGSAQSTSNSQALLPSLGDPRVKPC